MLPPWAAHTPGERHLERRYRARILELSRDRREAFLAPSDDDNDVDGETADADEASVAASNNHGNDDNTIPDDVDNVDTKAAQSSLATMGMSMSTADGPDAELAAKLIGRLHRAGESDEAQVLTKQVDTLFTQQEDMKRAMQEREVPGSSSSSSVTPTAEASQPNATANATTSPTPPSPPQVAQKTTNGKGAALPVRDAASALASDRALRELRFQLVPRRMSEETFWRRYFRLVEAARAEVAAEVGLSLPGGVKLVTRTILAASFVCVLTAK
jgi:hypothetical protein